ncbi:hypothetical protein [Nocardia transvalensis]|uniref:hypothetical protein n=1 Tax=Nocardia transvalensis TaxID=37333 RepID=UPI0018940BBD|nr:hypothetical protein [Nocardia transvalensis]MBF6333459.1 hypothetical protein [Nocardia transvalensis]
MDTAQQISDDCTDDQRYSDTMPYGPIRPEHATGSWRLEGDEREWWLWKPLGADRVQVKAATATTCVWSVVRAGGYLLQEAPPARDVEDAKAQADYWIAWKYLP